MPTHTFDACPYVIFCRERSQIDQLQALMREQMRTTDRALSNIESHPEGFNMLRRLYENVQV